ncbi:hypothetical protein JOM56_009625 [Amanita muscaria]
MQWYLVLKETTEWIAPYEFEGSSEDFEERFKQPTQPNLLSRVEGGVFKSIIEITPSLQDSAPSEAALCRMRIICEVLKETTEWIDSYGSEARSEDFEE